MGAHPEFTPGVCQAIGWIVVPPFFLVGVWGEVNNKVVRAHGGCMSIKAAVIRECGVTEAINIKQWWAMPTLLAAVIR